HVKSDWLLATQDWHPRDHGSFAAITQARSRGTASFSTASNRFSGPCIAFKTRTALNSPPHSTQAESLTRSTRESIPGLTATAHFSITRIAVTPASPIIWRNAESKTFT